MCLVLNRCTEKLLMNYLSNISDFASLAFLKYILKIFYFFFLSFEA